MKPSFLFRAPLHLLAMILAWAGPVSFAAPDALPFLSPLFGEHMVLQRGKLNFVWGWTKPGSKVTVTLDGHPFDAVAGADGRWVARVQPPQAGGPYRMQIVGAERLEFSDILVGDVWLCGGQSNMEMGMGQIKDAEAEIQAADHPKIRLFQVATKWRYSPAPVPEGNWKPCTPQSVREGGWIGFSATGYFFGRKVHQETGVPIGLVQDCLGGTTAEAWTSPAGLAAFPEFANGLKIAARTVAKGGEEYGSFIWHWFEDNDPRFKEWFAPQFNDSAWPVVPLNDAFPQLKVPAGAPAVAYFRKTVELPDPLPPGDARILLGRIERMDTVQINGVQVGASAWVQNPRNYPFGGWILKPGKNTIVVRVLRTAPDGGFQTPSDQFKLVLADKTEIPLAGGWKGAVSALPKADALPGDGDYGTWPPGMPSCLYNGMIAPVAPLAITGVIWYQGESNASRAAQYRRLLPAMIADWRANFRQGDIPFYVVSLASFMGRKTDPNAPDEWADLRAAQDYASQTVPNSGLAVTIDVGEANDIHPKDKQTVGQRLALIALARHYGQKIACSGPRFASATREGGGLRVKFTHAEGGLVVKGGELGEFSVKDKSGVWHWARAKIEGDTVLVASPEASDPVAVRYAWQANPLATLYNKAGLPGVPFDSSAQADRK